MADSEGLEETTLQKDVVCRSQVRHLSSWRRRLPPSLKLWTATIIQCILLIILIVRVLETLSLGTTIEYQKSLDTSQDQKQERLRHRTVKLSATFVASGAWLVRKTLCTTLETCAFCVPLPDTCAIHLLCQTPPRKNQNKQKSEKQKWQKARVKGVEAEAGHEELEAKVEGEN